MNRPQPKTYEGVRQLIDGIQREVEERVPQGSPSLSLLHEARGHLFTAVLQAHPQDDQVIAEHVRQALLLVDMSLKLSERLQ